MLGIIHGENFPWGRKFLEDGLSRGYFTLGEFARIPARNSFHSSNFLFAKSILHVEMLRGIIQGKFPPGWNCQEDLSLGGDFALEKFSMGKFSTESIRQGYFLRE